MTGICTEGAAGEVKEVGIVSVPYFHTSGKEFP